MSRVVVVGAGLAGLAAAVRLAARGHAVTVLEAHPEPGGKARAHVAAGGHIDLGPTMLVDLAPLAELCAEAGVSVREAIAVERIDPGFVARFPEAEVAFCADPERQAAEVARLGPEAERDWRRVLDLGARAARLAAHFNARGDVRDPRDLLGFILDGRLALGDLAPFARHRSLVAILDHAVRTPSLRALLAHFARFIGLEAGAAPSAALVIPYLLATGGVWYPRGGASALAGALALLARKHGAALELGDAVTSIDRDGSRARAVETAGGRRHPADAVVVTADVRDVAAWLGGDLARRAARLEPALSARVAWWLVEGPVPLPSHHAFQFPARDSVEPLYACVPTLSDPTLAPPGHAIVYTLLHGAPGLPATAAFGESMRARLHDAGWWPSGGVVASGVDGGETSCYGYRIGAGLFGSFRPSPRLRDIDNVVLAGAGVFPGPGVANVLRSGLRAASLVDARLAAGRR